MTDSRGGIGWHRSSARRPLGRLPRELVEEVPSSCRPTTADSQFDRHGMGQHGVGAGPCRRASQSQMVVCLLFGQVGFAMRPARVCCCLLALIGVVSGAEAGQARTAPRTGLTGSSDLRAAEEPSVPPPPDVIARDELGQVTIRAVRIATPLRIDGLMDEAVYTTVSPMSGFIQQEPREGMPATERTEVWFLFDNENIYVVARCWASVDTQNRQLIDTAKPAIS